MLEQMSQTIEPLGQVVGTVGALGSFLSFLLAIFLEWGNIKARGKGQAPLQGQHYAQSIAETEPAMRVQVGAYPAAKSPGPDIAHLIGKLLLDLVKTMFAIFMAIVVSAEYLLFADNHLGIGMPFQWLLIASLAIGSILGAYLRTRSWLLLLLIGILSQIGMLALIGPNLQDVPAILESFVTSSVVAGL